MKVEEIDQSRLFNSIVFSGMDFKKKFNSKVMNLISNSIYFELRVSLFLFEEIIIETEINKILKK